MNGIDITPPAEIKTETSGLVAWARALVIRDETEYAEAGDRLKMVKSLKKQIADFFTPLKRKQDEAKRAILDAEKDQNTPLDEVENLAKAALQKYMKAEADKAAALQKKLQEEADAQAARDRKALEAKAAAAKKPETIAKHQEAAAAIVAPVIHVPVAAPKISGITTIKTWAFEIIDAAQVPDAYKLIDEVKLGKYARAMGATASVPGVRFYQKESISAGSR